MLDQQIESVSNKLIQFIQDLTTNIETCVNNQNHSQQFLDLFQLRSDYAKQLASLFDMLITRLIEQILLNRSIQIALNLDPIQTWRSIQISIDKLNDMQWPDLHLIIKHIRTINNYFYNLLLQIKNAEFLKVDQTRTLNQNLYEELNHLAESLIHFTTVFYLNSQNINNTKTEEYSKQQIPNDTYLFQGASTKQYSNNNNQMNETMPNLSSTDNPNSTPAMNANCYPCNMTSSLSPQQRWTGTGRGYCFQPNQVRCPKGTVPTAGGFPYPTCGNKPMGCGASSETTETRAPLCFPTPVVYTPEMETLFSSSGIIYARKSGNTWIAENLGTLIETLKDIGQSIDMNEHCEILVRKTGELLVRRKRGRRKRFLQQTLNKVTPRGNNAYEETTRNQQQTDSNISNDDDQ